MAYPHETAKIHIIQLSSWMMAAGLIFTFISGLVLFALLTGRLKKLVAAVDAFSSTRTAIHLNSVGSILEIAIKHCLRLNHLVSELLELARVESAEMKINPEDFLDVFQ